MIDDDLSVRNSLSSLFRSVDLEVEAFGSPAELLRKSEDRASSLHARFESLTSRQRQVLVLAAKGLMNKNIAAEIGVSEITVKLYRRSVMKKMDVRTFVELVRIADALGLHSSAKSL